MSRLPVSVRIALRDMRSGLQGFRIFLMCLVLGVAAIAIVGSLSDAIERGIAEQGQPLLGGDIEFSIIHRKASEQEQAFFEDNGRTSTVATLRGMASTPDARSLVEVKAVDGLYPLYGSLELEQQIALAQALEQRNGRWGGVAEPTLLARLNAKPGDVIRIGELEIELRASIKREPDRVADGFILGPRLMISSKALQATGLIQPGSLVRWHYRIALEGASEKGSILAVGAKAQEQFPDSGWRIRTRDRAAPGVERFIDRLTFFLTLVGLTALIVGGVGVANSVNAFVIRRQRNIAMLKCLGAPSDLVFQTYLIEVLIIASLGIAIGLTAGALTPLIAGGLFASVLPVPVSMGVEPLPLIRAAAFGLLVTLAFSIWPLARAKAIQPSALFRDIIEVSPKGPAMIYRIICLLALIAIAALALAIFPNRHITWWYIAGITGSFLVLSVLARAMMSAARRMPKPASAVGRFAIANLYRPGAPTPSIVLSLGLGLSLFVTLTLIDTNISRELRSSLPDRAPSFFFLSVQNDIRKPFMEFVGKHDGVKTVETAPMLRGRVMRINDTPVKKVKATPDTAWALRGDRGLTYSETIPEGSTLVAGEWWPKDYSGEPLVSISQDIAEGIGLKLGDTVTVNVLGREITARVANFRQLDWRSLQINFVMVFSPNTLQGAPHMNIVTVEMTSDNEPALLQAVSRTFPTVTPVRVKDALDAVNDLLAKLLAAVRGANAVTFIVGLLVLTGALATGLASRTYDAVILKTYGATRRQLINAFALEYAILGLVTAAFAVLAGGVSAWALVRFVMEMPWEFSLPTAGITALLAMSVTVTAGLLTTRSALGARPARQLRTE